MELIAIVMLSTLVLNLVKEVLPERWPPTEEGPFDPIHHGRVAASFSDWGPCAQYLHRPAGQIR